MRKAALTPLYVSIAWTLMVSYQLFTQTAVVAIVTSLNTSWPSTLIAWLLSHTETVVLIHGFAWLFVLSTVIPSVLLGKERSMILHFFVCLMLTLASFLLKETLPLLIDQSIEEISNLSEFLHNPVLAGTYLSAPYLLMLILDIRSNRIQNRKRQEMIQKINL